MKEIDKIEKNINGESSNDTKLVLTIINIENPNEVLKKAQEVMKEISKFAYTKKWPSDHDWQKILPNWFVETMTTKSLKEIMATKGQWHFESWIESMHNRAWEWHSSKVDNDSIIITINLLNFPYVFEQFLYIFYSQGIPLENMSDIDDVYGFTQYGNK